MRVSKKVRDAAIEALLLCADDRWSTTNDFVSGEADELADAAFGAVLDVIGARAGAVAIYREAAGLLLDGWLPGDPVEVRK